MHALNAAHGSRGRRVGHGAWAIVRILLAKGCCRFHAECTQ